jgi:hypothetical protein
MTRRDTNFPCQSSDRSMGNIYNAASNTSRPVGSSTRTKEERAGVASLLLSLCGKEAGWEVDP